MHIYDATNKQGLHIHLSMSNTVNSNYIFVHNVFSGMFSMRYFTDLHQAMEFIHSINLEDDY
jgi:hypothetical protein